MQLKDGADAHGISAGRSTFALLEETLVGTDGGIGQLGMVGAVGKVAVSLADVHMVKQIGAHKMGIALVRPIVNNTWQQQHGSWLRIPERWGDRPQSVLPEEPGRSRSQDRR